MLLDMVTERRPQACLLAMRVVAERQVDALIERSLDATVEEVARLGARRAELGDPLLEGAGARGELVERELNRVRFEPWRLRCVRGRVARLGRARSQQQRLALLRRRSPQTLEQGSQPLAPAGADGEELRVRVTEQVAER
jgi:uncharacterized protein YigA (DUF484 family)